MADFQCFPGDKSVKFRWWLLGECDLIMTSNPHPPTLHKCVNDMHLFRVCYNKRLCRKLLISNIKSIALQSDDLYISNFSISPFHSSWFCVNDFKYIHIISPWSDTGSFVQCDLTFRITRLLYSRPVSLLRLLYLLPHSTQTWPLVGLVCQGVWKKISADWRKCYQISIPSLQ